MDYVEDHIIQCLNREAFDRNVSATEPSALLTLYVWGNTVFNEHEISQNNLDSSLITGVFTEDQADTLFYLYTHFQEQTSEMQALLRKRFSTWAMVYLYTPDVTFATALENPSFKTFLKFHADIYRTEEGEIFVMSVDDMAHAYANLYGTFVNLIFNASLNSISGNNLAKFQTPRTTMKRAKVSFVYKLKQFIVNNDVFLLPCYVQTFEKAKNCWAAKKKKKLLTASSAAEIKEEDEFSLLDEDDSEIFEAGFFVYNLPRNEVVFFVNFSKLVIFCTQNFHITKMTDPGGKQASSR